MNGNCTCGSSRLNTSYVYAKEELDSGVPSLSSSLSSSEFYGCQKRIDYQSPRYGLLEEALENELIRSEKRRSALGESLKNAQSALRYQKSRLEGQDCDLQNNESRLENLLQRQEHLETRMCYLKHRKMSHEAAIPYGSKCDNKESQTFNLQVPDVMTEAHRINMLEKEINNINLKMKTRVPQNTSNHSNLISLYEERQVQLEEKLEELCKQAQQMAAKCTTAEQERDSIDLQMISLKAELHQANVTSKNLEKECMKLQSQLLASRNINETLHLDMSSLKQRAIQLEDTVHEFDNEKKCLHLKLEKLEKEKQQLQSQKDLLHEMLKMRRKKRKSMTKNESSYGPSQSLEKTTEIVQEYIWKEQPVPGDVTPVSKISLQEAASRDSQKKYKARKHADMGNSKVQSTYHQKFTDKKHKKEKLEQEHLDSKKTLQVEKQFSDQTKGSCLGSDRYCKSSKKSGHSEVLIVHYQHLGNVLKKLESLLRSNLSLDHEKDQVLKSVLGILEKLKDANVLSVKSRDKVERLLNEHVNLIKNCHKRENQITSVIIELKHLRKAFHGVLNKSEDADDKKSMLWISRVQAIKDSLNILTFQEQKTESMENDISVLVKGLFLANEML
ncbi:uncharacterized protein LOC128490732 [Spea bombifrons]|uniref:uncharacterized protein LOC128490732 n=1 Tax=Spea bombifrons TaxID=233779 RepID=UPI00234A1617|nr:uncharacterized protein LOC128490732 [Spea bombifrons]